MSDDYAAENRPWTRWWWMGSALDEAEITRHLEDFQAVGIGGVEISPIYGARDEARFISFLTDRWIALLDWTLREATRLGMGVDLIAGTGWPYGGPWVPDADAPQRRDPKAPADTFTLIPTGQQVKRAAPGGEGNVVSPFSAEATERYLAAFDAPLRKLTEGRRVRCFFNDSYEVFGANATPDLLDEFLARRGYDLRPHLAALNEKDTSDTARRVRADYRATMGELLHDHFLAPWTAWAGTHGARTRQQAHGSPGNLLDLYAIADIPETEIFGPPRLAKAGLTPLRPAPPDFGEAQEALVCRFASSAAHVAGRPLCSSESFTWMGEHGCVPLEHAKAEVDTLFTLGINHLFFHGTPSSPADAPWPGHLFYATTHIAPTNPWWRDLATLNAYIARCQSVLQSGAPDNDILLYFPYHDLLATDNGTVDGLHFLTVHKTATWLGENLKRFTVAANELSDLGYTFDLVSDRQLREAIEVDAEGTLLARNGEARWKAIVVAGCHVMPPETMERLAALAQAGATVIFDGELPANVPGFAALDAQQARLQVATKTLCACANTVWGESPNLLHNLGEAKIPLEPIAFKGIEFARRRNADGSASYFLANPGTTDWEGWIPLIKLRGDKVALLDPMTGEHGAAETRWRGTGYVEVRLAIAAGASLIVMERPHPPSPSPRVARSSLLWGEGESYPSQPLALEKDSRNSQTPPRPTGARNERRGERGKGGEGFTPWQVTFLSGGPTLPDPREIPALADWTTWTPLSPTDTDALRAFSGTARYGTTFDAPPGFDESADYEIDLGVVCHSARVRLNGIDCGTLIARPWKIRLTAGTLRATGNVLEIEVTNLMANRLADLERREGDAWRPFLMVNIHYKPFDAAQWEPLPSGLIGPVRLIAYPPLSDAA